MFSKVVEHLKYTLVIHYHLKRSIKGYKHNINEIAYFLLKYTWMLLFWFLYTRVFKESYAYQACDGVVYTCLKNDPWYFGHIIFNVKNHDTITDIIVFQAPQGIFSKGLTNNDWVTLDYGLQCLPSKFKNIKPLHKLSNNDRIVELIKMYNRTKHVDTAYMDNFCPEIKHYKRIVNKIEASYLAAYWNPAFSMCQRRLLREFTELCRAFSSREQHPHISREPGDYYVDRELQQVVH